MKEINSEQIAMRVSWHSLLVNAALSVMKLAAGLIGRSGAMVSDAVHSASDVFSTVIVMIGVKIANKESDADHQYGHERFECVAAILLSVALFLTGGGIGLEGIRSIAGGNYQGLSIPGQLALAAAVVSILVKEAMYWYTRSAAKKIQSGVLMADAWHHRSDALSSVGSFIGILGARLGFPIMDPLASIVICLFVMKAAFDIFMDAINKMTDRACDEQLVGEMREVICQEAGVLGIDEIKTRLFADKIYVDIEIRADGEATLNETHATAQRVHDLLESKFPQIKHCMVHVNPENTKE